MALLQIQLLNLHSLKNVLIGLYTETNTNRKIHKIIGKLIVKYILHGQKVIYWRHQVNQFLYGVEKFKHLIHKIYLKSLENF